MKKMKKIFALLIAMVMVLGMSTSVFAAGTGSITITPPSGTASDTTNTYKIYKVFDADGNGTAISYKVKSNHGTAVPEGFIRDDGGNVILGTVVTTETATTIKTMVGGTETIIEPQTTELTAAQIAAIAAYVTEADLVDTITSTGTTAATKEGLENGYYYVTTSTGTAVTITTTNPNAEVIDKNVITPPDKKITGIYNADGTINEGSLDAEGQKAIGQLGSKVNYEATVTKSHGAKKYVFHDVMGSGLTYNNDVKVYIGETEVEAGATTFNTTTASGDTITITFVDSYIQGLADETVLTIKYSATINSDALTVDTGKNTASLQYGDNNSVIPSPDTPQVYNAKITVNKTDGSGTALAGAGFILKNNADNTYYIKNGNDVNWGTETEATVLTTAVVEGKAVVEFTGLKDGSYTLIEKVVPAGYNKAADETFTIAAADANLTADRADLSQETTVVNNSGSVLPSTGGMGTTIFYIIGAILVIGAGVVLVTRRRMNAN